jgi:sugar O-acyltransferase (sialic acid O-acetyltransferase NeuD family)
MRSLVLIGSGGHARSCLDVLTGTDFVVKGCVGGTPVGRLQTDYLGTDEVLADLQAAGVDNALVAVGDNRVRQRLTAQLIALGYALPAVVSAEAFVSETATLGDGAVVMHRAVVGPFSRIGRGAIVNTSASVDHDCVIGDFAHVAPGVHLAGEVQVGEGALLGVGIAAIPGVSIGEWSVVGAGAVVVTDIPRQVVALGTPARVTKERVE